MGDQIGEIVNGKLIYIPLGEFLRLKNSGLSKPNKLKLLSSLCRINVLYMVANAGSGHLGSSFSSMEIMSLLLSEIDEDKMNEDLSPVFFSSKGHDAPALYSVMLGLGNLDFSLIHQLRRLNGLPGHPDIHTPGIVTNTGSLGMGVSKAKGMILADRIKKINRNYYVLTGDGELQEGQFWESLISAKNFMMGELTVIIDHNKLQSDTFVNKVSDLGDLEAKLISFGWKVYRVNGNDIEALLEVVEEGKKVTDQPKVIIADTIKGKGVSFMEHISLDSDVEYYKFHSGAPNEDNYNKAVVELLNTSITEFEAFGLGDLIFEEINRKGIPSVSFGKQEKLVQAYSTALILEAEKNPNVVAFDADLILDTGLISFKERFPDRFIECGIAEQDMVSSAGGMALNGLLPIVHSFSCFLSSRPNEQIYNNITEKTKVIYVGSLSGLLPAGPGHSHQAVRDIASLSSCPGLIIVEPCCEEETQRIVQWAINEANTSVYIRLVSIPVEIPFKWNEQNCVPGKGTFVKTGTDTVIVSYGPLFLKHAYEVAEKLENEKGISVAVMNFPWLNEVDYSWFASKVKSFKSIVTIDNHYFEGGLGQKLNSVISQQNINIKVVNFAVNGIPRSGQPLEVLSFHELDSDSIFNKIENIQNL
jgi:transketolase